jgi:hypothetical protein
MPTGGMFNGPGDRSTRTSGLEVETELLQRSRNVCVENSFVTASGGIGRTRSPWINCDASTRLAPVLVLGQGPRAGQCEPQWIRAARTRGARVHGNTMANSFSGTPSSALINAQQACWRGPGGQNLRVVSTILAFLSEQLSL